MSIGVYVARRALIDALAAKTAVGQPLDGWQVSYAAPGNMGLLCIYGGGFRFDHTPTVAEPDVLVDETTTVVLVLRAMAKTPAEVRDTDTLVETGAAQVTAVLAASPNLGGGLSWQGISGGQGDYGITDDEVWSTLGLQVVLGKRVTYA
jgi:hypothetical protein